jgi:hypothetical protein
MLITKITTKDGQEFFNTDCDSNIATRPDVASIELVDMTPEEYQSIPTSQSAKDFFDV